MITITNVILMLSFHTCLSFTTYPTTTKSNTFKIPSQTPLSSSEIAQQAQQIKESAPSSIFEESLVDDMTRCIKLLGKRVDNGPGSLTVLEVEEMNIGIQRIINEMDAYASSGTVKNVIDVIPEPTQSSPKQAAESKTGYGVTDVSEDEGPEYTGKGGFGMAQGTTNTYVIPGMEEMTPEEYRVALQNSVSERQARRKSQMGSFIGNRQSQSYLDNLGNPNRFQN